MITLELLGVRDLSLEMGVPSDEDRILELAITLPGQTLRIMMSSGRPQLQDKFVELWQAWEKIKDDLSASDLARE